MLVIRDAQMEILRRANVHRWLVQYLQRCYPDQAAQLGTAALYSFVKVAAENARSRHFLADTEMRKYVHIAFVLGPDFETRPEYRWAVRILDNPDYHDAATQLREVEDKMVNYLTTQSPVGREEPSQ